MATFTPDTSNEMFQLAIQLVNQSNRNIFLTGKAGTGKTTFLKYIRENCPKQIAIVAPTGVAAINAGGVTIHSFFQLPLSPYIPETKGKGFTGDGDTLNAHSLTSRLRFNSDKKKILQQLEILVIDEISMVRCDVLDAIDTVLRYIRQKPTERFGGVQVLFIGDMLQLPPVVKQQEWNLLSPYYSGQYFFNSRVLEDDPPVYIEFNKIYRQKDEQFIQLLNQVRNNELDAEGMRIFDSRFLPNFRRSKQDGYIILTTHNHKAAEINEGELRNLDSNLFRYEAEVQDEFSDRSYPAEEVLQLKVGAQVMFIRNDSAERGKRYFNGKIGIVSKLEADKIVVLCALAGQLGKEESVEIEVQKEKWENIKYTFNKTTRQLDSDILGSFTQYPLRLAWAITIHKSQGLTFEKAIIDAGESFAPGQVYVALSRCTSLEGMVLQSRVRSTSLFNDPQILAFSGRSSSGSQLQEELAIATQLYQQGILLSTFDFSTAFSGGKELKGYLLEHVSSFNAEALEWTEQFLVKLSKLQETAIKFQTQLRSFFVHAEVIKENRTLQERIKAASDYFVPEIGSLIQFIQQSPAVTDSRQHAKEYNEYLQDIFAELAMKRFMLEGFTGSLEMEAFHLRKQGFVLPSFTVTAYAGASYKRIESPHPVLYQQLRTMRDNICSQKKLPIYIVAGSKTIEEMAYYLPHTLKELRKVSGFGDAKIEKFGQPFLDIILAYMNENNLSSRIHDKLPKKERKETTGGVKIKGRTHAETYKLYKEGQSITEIASARNLSIGTIETHMTRFIRSGEIRIEELITPEKLAIIESAVKNFTGGSITPIKQFLGSEVSFGEIRLVMAGLSLSAAKLSD